MTSTSDTVRFQLTGLLKYKNDRETGPFPAKLDSFHINRSRLSHGMKEVSILATWIAHLRIAENLLDRATKLHKNAFAAGSIAPDSGVPNEDWSYFDPPGHVTHWKNSEGRIDADDFFDKYIAFEQARDHETLSFLLGYYVHLLTDIEWQNLYRDKWEEPAHKELMGRDAGYIWRIKEDWYGQDFDYLKDNEQSLFFYMLSEPDGSKGLS